MKRKSSKSRREAPAPAREATQPKTPLTLRARAYILGWLPAIAIILGARALLAEPFRIPSGSMEPTLLVGDWLFVNKLRYGPHIPFTNHSLPGYAEPRRGDVATFISPPQDPSIRIAPDEVTPLLVKRIVAVGGDTVMMRGGQLMVNSVAMPSPQMNPSDTAAGAVAQPIFQWQRDIAVTGSRFGEPPADPTMHHWGPLVVPAGHYFMMGDNRDYSVDSRFYGTVPRENLRGTTMFVYYSFDTRDGIDPISAVVHARWRRVGTWIR